MSGPKIKAINGVLPEVKFNMDAQEQFARSRGVVFEHWAAIPSPIGKKDRGDYRRPDVLDTVSENGFIYKKVGEFIGTILGNSKSNQYGPADGGIYDNSTGRIVIPKYYECTENKKKKEISLLPGDRIYAKDIELNIENYQQAQYSAKNVDYLQFPAKCVSTLIDSNNVEYKEGVHFKITKDGNIKWYAGKKNPGIDPETGKGRIYSVRYEYNAFWYIQQLVNEIRITNEDGADTPTRMPYHAVIQREYVYHNKNRGDEAEIPQREETPRTNPEPEEKLPTDEPQVRVDIRNFTE